MSWTYLQRISREVKGDNPQAARSAKGKLAAAMKQDPSDAMTTLNMVLRMDLPDTVQTDRVLAQAYQMLGDLYTATPSKQVSYYAAALQFTAEPLRRAALENKINELGGDVFALTFRPQVAAAGTRDAGDDGCLDAVAITLDHSEIMNVFPAGDHNWRVFDVAGPEGQLVHIETFTDTPGTFADDTDLTLWGGCEADGFPSSLLAFDDDGGFNFMSAMDTACLVPGSYYIEVGGFFDVTTPDNFELQVNLTSTCEVPVPDSFEPDNARGDESDIGYPTANSPRGNGWGRSKKEVQSHSFFPTFDVDLMELDLTQNSHVRVSTRAQVATFFNGFDRQILGADDTVINILHQSPVNYGGFCNEPDIGFPNFCITDADCPNLPNPLPGFDDCIPLYQFNDFAGVFSGPDPELAGNDDAGGGDLGSSVAMCLPRSHGTSFATAGAANGPWLIQAFGFDPGALFNYEIEARNEANCNFEKEPNNGPLLGAATGTSSATDHVDLGDTVNGFFDFSETTPFADDDWYQIDVPDGENSRLTFRTYGYDEFEVDTGIELLVGPGDGICSGSGDPCATDDDCPSGETCDDNDLFFLVANDDDGGEGFLSRMDVLAPGPNDILGNVANDASYYMNVTSFFLNHNYPYQLRTALNRAPDAHAESDDDCEGEEGSSNGIGSDAVSIGEIDPSCDLDAYKLSVDVNTYVRIDALGGDFAMQLVDCDTGDVLACDDDGGDGLNSRLEGCLSPGDYCVQVRAFSTGTGAYGLEITGNEGCVALDPPSIVGDGAFTCTDFGSCP
jgi:hypothetical protein